MKMNGKKYFIKFHLTKISFATMNQFQDGYDFVERSRFGFYSIDAFHQCLWSLIFVARGFVWIVFVVVGGGVGNGCCWDGFVCFPFFLRYAGTTQPPCLVNIVIVILLMVFPISNFGESAAARLCTRPQMALPVPKLLTGGSRENVKDIHARKIETRIKNNNTTC